MGNLPDSYYEKKPQKKESQDDWIPWKGGECPVSLGQTVKVKYGFNIISGKAGDFAWKHNGSGDIFAYKIII